MRIASFLRVARVALVALFFSSFIHMGDAKKSSCPIPASYLQGLDWTDAKAKCLLVGDGKSAAPCDACFAAFLRSVSKDLTILQYIDLGQVLADGPAKTLSKVGKACGKTIQSVLSKQLSKAEKKKAKKVNKCFKYELDVLPQTNAAIGGLVG